MANFVFPGLRSEPPSIVKIANDCLLQGDRLKRGVFLATCRSAHSLSGSVHIDVVLALRPRWGLGQVLRQEQGVISKVCTFGLFSPLDTLSLAHSEARRAIHPRSPIGSSCRFVIKRKGFADALVHG